MRLLTNKLIMFNNISAIFAIIGSSGHITFMGRMMEVQFNRSSHGGSMFTGPITILGVTIGFLSSGYLITKYKPPPKYLFLWNVAVGVLSVSVQVFYTQLGCGGDKSSMLSETMTSCDANCNCTCNSSIIEAHPGHIITPRACAINCDFDYYFFSIISMVSSFLSVGGRIGNVLLNLR